MTQVRTGREAIALSSTRRFDVVLTDLGLPDISRDLLVRQLLATAKPLVVVMTGQGEPHLGRAKAEGAHAVFQKPIEWHRIVTYLRRGVDRAAVIAAREPQVGDGLTDAHAAQLDTPEPAGQPRAPNHEAARERVAGWRRDGPAHAREHPGRDRVVAQFTFLTGRLPHHTATSRRRVDIVSRQPDAAVHLTTR